MPKLTKFYFDWHIDKQKGEKEIIVDKYQEFKNTPNALLKPKSQRFPWVDFNCLTSKEHVCVQCKTGSSITADSLKINYDKSVEVCENIFQSLNIYHDIGKY